MAGVGGLSSLGLFLLLLLASSSAAREERSSRTWTQVTTDNQGNYKYLALLTVGGVAKCSGSIPSQWTVLTYCKDATDEGNTKAYAGLLKVAEAVDEPNVGIQKRVVKSVAAHETHTNLKICTLNKNWDLNNKVGIVDLPVQSGSGRSMSSCTLLGFKADGDAQQLEGQNLGDTTPCPVGAEDATNGLLHIVVQKADLDGKGLKDLDYGGPAVCGDKQRGINKEYKSATDPDNGGCNWFFDVAKLSPWIEEQKQAAEEAGASGGTGGTGGNGTSPSSGYSIHSHLNKYSNWKVLAFLVPTIVTFLQY